MDHAIISPYIELSEKHGIERWNLDTIQPKTICQHVINLLGD